MQARAKLQVGATRRELGGEMEDDSDDTDGQHGEDERERTVIALLTTL